MENTVADVHDGYALLSSERPIPMLIDGALTLPLIREASSDEGRARLRRAFDAHYAGVWRFLRRMGLDGAGADDTAQQAFLIALEAMPRIVTGSERAFLYATAVRLVQGQRRKSRRECLSEALDSGPSPLPAAEQLADQKRARDLLDAVVGQLEESARTIFVLVEFEGFTTPEAARLLEVPLGTAASRLRRAREKFEQIVETLK